MWHTVSSARFMKYYYAWLAAGELLFHAYFMYVGNFMWLYADLLFAFVCVLRYFWKQQLLPNFFYAAPSWKRYIVSAYGMVLLEEALAALINNLNEGFSWEVYGTRILQFWALNLLAFSGLILGALFLVRKQWMTKNEMIVFASIFGLYAEHQLALIFVNPIAVLVYAPIVVAIYYSIFTPALTLLTEPDSIRNMHRALRYAIAIVVVFVCTTPFIATLSYLRAQHPLAFPPCSMIECGEQPH